MRRLLIALDSVGIDPFGHDRPDSVYSESRFLFPRSTGSQANSPRRIENAIPIVHECASGVLIETDVTDGADRGAIECALTYTSIFSGQSALEQHGLMQGLGLKEKLLEEMVSRNNLFARFERPCLANAIFPGHLAFLGSSYAQHLVPAYSREQVEGHLTFRGEPMQFKGREKRGFAELFTLAEINQNIFVFAAREAGVDLRTWNDVRHGEALTSSMTHELENEFGLHFFGEEPLPPRTPEEAAAILARLSGAHDFTFYKYQIPDLVSHTGRVELAREVFATIERFVDALLRQIDSTETAVLITSDHGHLEQVAFTQGHPKSRVPTWYFGPNPEQHLEPLRRPEGVFAVLTGGRSSQFSIKDDL